MPTELQSHEPRNDSSLRELENRAEFVRRHIGPDDQQIKHMLDTLGSDSLHALVASTIPESIYIDEPLQLSASLSEAQTLKKLRGIADLNVLKHSMIGIGYHDTITPPVILRNIFENPGWYTAYTPYQATL